MERLKLKKKKLLMVSLRKGERSEEIRKPERRKMKGGNLNQTFLNVTSYLQILSCFTYGFYYRRTDKSVGIKSISFNLPTELNLWEILVSNV